MILRTSALGSLVFLAATAVLPHELGAIGTLVTFHKDGIAAIGFYWSVERVLIR